MSNYYEREDLRKIRELKTVAPSEYEAWANLDRIVAREDGAIPRKYRELIALAVAHTTQCPYCIEAHVRGAKKAGVTKAEVAEAILLAAALRAGAAAAHGGLTMKLFDEA
jgi:AhpD family alkylhydroperoxidase